MSNRYYMRPPDQVAYGLHYLGPVASATKRIDLHDERELFYPNFSGYAIPPDDDITVAQIERYYLHGQPLMFSDGSHGDAPGPDHLEQLRDDGKPISGDNTALFQHWRDTGEWPRLRDVWEHLGIDSATAPTKPACSAGAQAAPAAPVQLTIFDLLGDAA